MRWFLALWLTAAGARANTYSLDGAGATVVPIQRTSVKVVREELTIRPAAAGSCYQVMFEGKPYRSRRQLPVAELQRILDHHLLGVPGAGVACPKDLKDGVNEVGDGRVFHPVWQATVHYEMQSRERAEKVQMGFPLQLGIFDSLEAPADYQGGRQVTELDGWLMTGGFLPLVSTSAFQVRIDGEPISAQIKRLDLPAEPDSSRTLYVWEHTFEKGATTLDVEYQFDVGGFDAGEGAYPTKASDLSSWPFVFPETLSPADRAKLDEDVYAFVEHYFGFSAPHLLYWMKPISTWGGPPREIIATLELPPALTALHMDAHEGWQPDCVGEHRLRFRLRNRSPKQDLSFFYPNTSKHVVPMTRAGEWRAWRKHHPRTRVTCELLEKLRTRPGLKAILGSVSCVRECN